jgi:hypothetical protein
MVGLTTGHSIPVIQAVVEGGLSIAAVESFFPERIREPAPKPPPGVFLWFRDSASSLA